MQGSGCREQGARFRDQGAGFRIQGSGFMDLSPAARVYVLGCRGKAFYQGVSFPDAGTPNPKPETFSFNPKPEP